VVLQLKECHDPEMLPVDEVRIDPVKVNDIGLGKSIYTKEQLKEFARFQDSQGTRKAYLAETAEMAYTGRNEKGKWGLTLSSAAREPEDGEAKKKSMSLEDLRRKYSWWPSGHGKEIIRPPPQHGSRSRGECCPEGGEEHQILSGK
jgi:hypothetical protein